MKNLTIGGLAKQANVNVETIRYYERRRLLPQPLRTLRRQECPRSRAPRRRFRRTASVEAREAREGFSLPRLTEDSARRRTSTPTA